MFILGGVGQNERPLSRRDLSDSDKTTLEMFTTVSVGVSTGAPCGSEEQMLCPNFLFFFFLLLLRLGDAASSEDSFEVFLSSSFCFCVLIFCEIDCRLTTHID